NVAFRAAERLTAKLGQERGSPGAGFDAPVLGQQPLRVERPAQPYSGGKDLRLRARARARDADRAVRGQVGSGRVLVQAAKDRSLECLAAARVARRLGRLKVRLVVHGEVIE